MDKETFAAFKEKVKERGLDYPIILYQGKIIDGRNGYLAATELKIPFETKEYTGDNPLDYIFDNNFHRRHLSVQQRACCAAEYTQLTKMTFKDIHKRAMDVKCKRIQIKPTNQDPKQRTVYKAADKFNIGSGSVSRANTLLINAKDLFRKVKAGDESLQGAYRLWRKRLGSSPKRAKVVYKSTQENLSNSAGIAIPHAASAPFEVREFIKVMMRNGWLMEMKVKPSTSMEGEIEASYSVNFYGNGYVSQYSTWKDVQGEPTFERAVVVAAKEKLDLVKSRQQVAA